MNSKKIINSEYGLSHQGYGLSQNMEFETVLFDSFLDAKGGKGGPSSSGSSDSGTTTTPTSPVVTYTYTSGDNTVDDSQEFNIHIDFYGDLWTQEIKVGNDVITIDLKDEFITAADFLSGVITNDIAPDGRDDITIDASLIEIDGAGGVLGRAGPTSVWTANSLTSSAIMEFDVADAATFDSYGLWYDIILHEMIHTLGLGTLWNYQGLVTTSVIDDNNTKKPTDDVLGYVYKPDSLVHEASNTLYSTTNGVIIEDEGGSGTAGGHWDDFEYGNELMTGYLYPQIDDDRYYLSEMTFEALRDLGYVVDTSALDYTYVTGALSEGTIIPDDNGLFYV